MNNKKNSNKKFNKYSFSEIINKTNSFKMKIMENTKIFINKFIFNNNKIDNNKTINNTITLSIISVFSALILSILLFFVFKIFISEKQSYGEYNVSYVEPKSSQNTVEEPKIIEVERVSSNAIDEEISAQSSYKYETYKFNVDRTIVTKEKVHLFNSPNWNEFSDIVPENSKFNVDLITSPGGYMMYKISDGKHQGKFITANNNLINLDKINDNIDLRLIKKAIAIKILNNTNSYTSKDLKKIKAIVYKNVILNIAGIGISDNNRLIYHIEDGSFILADNSKLVETNRPVVNEEKDKKKDKTTTNKNKTNTQNNKR